MCRSNPALEPRDMFGYPLLQAGSAPRISRTGRTSPSGSGGDCFRETGRLHPLWRAELTIPTSFTAQGSSEAPPLVGAGRANGRTSACACARPTSERFEGNLWNSDCGDIDLSSGEWIGYGKTGKAVLVVWGSDLPISVTMGCVFKQVSR